MVKIKKGLTNIQVIPIKVDFEINLRFVFFYEQYLLSQQPINFESRPHISNDVRTYHSKP